MMTTLITAAICSKMSRCIPYERLADFNAYKIVLAIPMLLAAALITYISYQFEFNFLPNEFPVDREPIVGYILRIVFGYFSTMTYVFILTSFILSPGYLPDWLKVSPGRDGKAPSELLRIYNMRFWARNNIYNFEEFDYSMDNEAAVSTTSNDLQTEASESS